MADAYSFSSSMARKRRGQRKIRVASATPKETTDSVPPKSSFPAHEMPRSRSPQIEESKSPVRSPVSNTSNTSNTVNGHHHLARPAKAVATTAPPVPSMMTAMSSDSSDGSEEAYPKTKGTLANRKATAPTNGKRIEMTGHVSSLGSLRDNHDAINTDRTIVKKMSNVSSEDDSSSDTDDSDAPPDGKYNKYKKYLSSEPSQKEKWAAPQKKLGAAPQLDFTYRYAGSAPPPPPPKPEPPKPEASELPKPVIAKSQKLSKADNATIAFMLGGESDDDSASTASSGSRSTHTTRELASIGNNSPGHQFMDGQSTDDDAEPLALDDDVGNDDVASPTKGNNDHVSGSKKNHDDDSEASSEESSYHPADVEITNKGEEVLVDDDDDEEEVLVDDDDEEEEVLIDDDFSETLVEGEWEEEIIEEDDTDIFDESQSEYEEEVLSEPQVTTSASLMAQMVDPEKQVLKRIEPDDSDDDGDGSGSNYSSSDYDSHASPLGNDGKKVATAGSLASANKPKGPPSPQDNNSGSESSDTDTSLSRSEKSRSSRYKPPFVPSTVSEGTDEDGSEEDGLGEFLDSERTSGNSEKKTPKNSVHSGSDIETSKNDESNSECDFSEIWDQSVRTVEKKEAAKVSESLFAIDESERNPSKRVKTPSMPPTCPEDEEALGEVLDTEKSERSSQKHVPGSTKSGAGSMMSNTTDSSSDDDEDYSDVWAQSVKEESGQDRKAYVNDAPTSRDSDDDSSTRKPAKAIENSAKAAVTTAAISNELGESSSSSEGSFGFGPAASENDRGAASALASSSKEQDTLMSEPSMDGDIGSKLGGFDDSIKLDGSLKLREGSINAFDFGASHRSNGSMGEFSLNASDDILAVSDSKFDRPEYEPKRKNNDDSLSMGDLNQGMNINTSNLDLEASMSTRKDKPKKKTPRKKIPFEKPTFSTGLWRNLVRSSCCLLLLGAIGGPVYYFLFYETNNVEETPDIKNLFPAEYTIPPTKTPTAFPVAAPSTPPVGSLPTIRPTRMPTMPPTAPLPTASPTISTISELRAFLITVWPSLREDLIGFTSAQFKALDWLANNSNLDTYSDAKTIQRFALATLYFSTLGETWRNTDLWLSDEDECMWFTSSTRSPCDEGGTYTNLELDLNGLAGTIPPELALLSDGLSRIDFSRAGSRSFLSGSIPTELGLLTALTFVNLRGNQLTGAIPGEIGEWTETGLLDLSDNALSGALPTTLGRMTNVESLYLQGNQITGPLASELGRLTNIRYLNIAGNIMTGPVPSEFGNVQLLETLNLEMNQFTSLPSELGTLVLLRSFSVYNNNLAGPIPSEIGNMVELLSLDMSGNFLTGTIPTEFGNLFVIRGTHAELLRNPRWRCFAT
jgi:Leucine-rich repeat (LRR) protein